MYPYKSFPNSHLLKEWDKLLQLSRKEVEEIKASWVEIDNINFKTGDKFEIDADEISLEKHREEMKKKTVINPPEEIMDLELKSIMESIQWMERVKNDSTSAESIKLAETTLKALKKQIPEKPLIEPWSPALCKDCGEELSDHLNDDYYAHQYSRTVCDCGKKIYWGR